MILNVRRLLGFAALALALVVPAQSAQQRVNTGTTPGDRTGDQLPAAFGKVNANDTELYATAAALQAQLAALQAISGRLAALQAGTLDGVTIGGSAPAAGSFTTLNVSGGITGTLNGNAATATLAASATKLATARTFAVSGDASCSFTFDGTANAGCSLTLATTGVTAGTYGSASLIPVVTVDAKGRVTGISTAANAGGSGAVPTSRQILTSGLATGGGDLTADRTITVPKAAASDVATGTDDAKALTSLSVASALAAKAPLASPSFTGTPIAPTVAVADNSTKIATTAYADRAALAAVVNVFEANGLTIRPGATVASQIVVSANAIVLKGASAGLPLGAVSATISTGATGANGLDTGSIAASKWYAIHAIAKADGTFAGLLSLSATAPTLPSGYAYAARIGWARTKSDGSLVPIIQTGRSARYQTVSGQSASPYASIVSGAVGDVSTPTYVAVAVTNFAPPTAGVIWGQTYATNTGSNAVMVAPNPYFGNYAAIATAAAPTPPITSASGYNVAEYLPQPLMVESANVYVASQTFSGAVCLGWEDNL